MRGLVKEAAYRVRHYVRSGLLMVLGPAQQDEEHDPLARERREYARHRAARRA